MINLTYGPASRGRPAAASGQRRSRAAPAASLAASRQSTASASPPPLRNSRVKPLLVVPACSPRIVFVLFISYEKNNNNVELFFRQARCLVRRAFSRQVQAPTKCACRACFRRRFVERAVGDPATAPKIAAAVVAADGCSVPCGAEHAGGATGAVRAGAWITRTRTCRAAAALVSARG